MRVLTEKQLDATPDARLERGGDPRMRNGRVLAYKDHLKHY